MHENRVSEMRAASRREVHRRIVCKKGRIEGRMAASETAILGGGCFWCIEAVLQQLEGVQQVESGYMGGKRESPSYGQVCTGATGHVEVVRVHFDPAVISYGEVLEVFFTAHDPTTLNRQGNDGGTQYRSVIFELNDGQRTEADRVIAELRRKTVSSSADCDLRGAGEHLLEGGGLPPELLCQQLPPALLHVCGGSQGG